MLRTQRTQRKQIWLLLTRNVCVRNRLLVGSIATHTVEECAKASSSLCSLHESITTLFLTNGTARIFEMAFGYNNGQMYDEGWGN